MSTNVHQFDTIRKCCSACGVPMRSDTTGSYLFLTSGVWTTAAPDCRQLTKGGFESPPDAFEGGPLGGIRTSRR